MTCGARCVTRHVRHRYGGNSHLVYAIVRRKKVFQQLELLTLPAGEPATRFRCVATCLIMSPPRVVRRPPQQSRQRTKAHACLVSPLRPL